MVPKDTIYRIKLFSILGLAAFVGVVFWQNSAAPSVVVSAQQPTSANTAAAPNVNGAPAAGAFGP